MANIELVGAPAKGNGIIGAALRSLADKIALWNETRLTREALSRLSDRELHDIGLCRGQIAGFRLNGAKR